ncbi:MAG: hypothetical protein ACJ8C4_18960 [Gemmataceae bacterium]
MPRLLACSLMILAATWAVAQAEQEKVLPRFGVEADVARYLQKTPKDALRSALKAIGDKRIDYLLAHLAEPSYVDQQIKKLDGSFEKAVAETSRKLNGDPESIREMRKFLSDGEFGESQGDTVEVKCGEVKSRKLYLRKVGTRWFLENRDGTVKEKQ